MSEKKNRTITTVSGFEKIPDLNIKELAKKMGKKFGCGTGTITKDAFEL